jgi:hypothetical protein
MDSLIAAAARALAVGDALGALKHVACATTRPRSRSAASPWPSSATIRAPASCCGAPSGLSAHEALARARCVVAEAEVALAMRDLGISPRTLATAATALEARADRANALHARLIAVRRLLLLGRLDEAAAELADLDTRGLPPALLAVTELATAELALRSLRTASAQARSAARTTPPNARAYPRSWPR